MAINRLSVVNDMLALLGELPINDLDAFHPVVPRALATLATVNETVQANKWWFNTEYPKMVPQVGTGFIMVSDDCLSIDSLTPYPRVTKRGNRLYNLDKSTYEFDKPIDVVFQRLIPFDDLSTQPRAYIRARAVLQFNVTIDGDPIKTQALEKEVRDTYITFNAEHIRSEKSNMLRTPSVAHKLNNMIGTKRNMLRY